MIFSVQDYRAAFTEAYEYGMQHAGPLTVERVNEMFGDLNALKEGEGALKRGLMKAVIAYLCDCYYGKEGGG